MEGDKKYCLIAVMSLIQDMDLSDSGFPKNGSEKGRSINSAYEPGLLNRAFVVKKNTWEWKSKV